MTILPCCSVITWTLPDCCDDGDFGNEPLPEPYYNWNSWADPLASKIAFAPVWRYTGQAHWKLLMFLLKAATRTVDKERFYHILSTTLNSQ